MIPVATVITIALLINQRLKILPIFEEIERKSYGTFAYGLSITILLILFWPTEAAAVCAGILVMSFGDGLAGLIGPQIQSPSWKVFGQRKSIAGTLSMVITGAIILLLINTLSGAHLHPLEISIITLIAVCLEQIGPWGIDNLSVPIVVAWTWSFLSKL